MKHLKNFNEASSVKLFSKGEILIFSNPGVSEDTIRDISNKLGCQFIKKWEIGTDTYLIKTKPGQEKIIGQDFINNYPEFFNGYERRDINFEGISNLIEDIKSRLDDLDEFYGNSNGRINLKINDEVDLIIKDLQKLKI